MAEVVLVLYFHSSTHMTQLHRQNQCVTILAFAVKHENVTYSMIHIKTSFNLAHYALSHVLNIAFHAPPPLLPSPHRLFIPLRVSGGGATTLCHQAVTPELVPCFLLLWLSMKAVDRHSIHMAGQMFDHTVKLYLDRVGSQAVPQWEDAFVSHNLWETINHSSEMDVNSTEVRQPSTLCL